MTDFNPGPGWHEISGDELVDDKDMITFSGDFNTRWWVREDPVPPLPTEPYTVIRAHWSENDTLYTDLWLAPVGWVSRLGSVYGEADMAQLVRFKVLSEPRAVTAKAVLDRIADYDRSGTVGVRLSIAREFGVES